MNRLKSLKPPIYLFARQKKHEHIHTRSLNHLLSIKPTKTERLFWVFNFTICYLLLQNAAGCSKYLLKKPNGYFGLRSVTLGYGGFCSVFILPLFGVKTPRKRSLTCTANFEFLELNPTAKTAFFHIA